MGKIAICAIVKNENLYLRDWVEYHKNLGISKIFIYDNNDFWGEHPEDVLQDYIEENFVEVTDIRGIEKGLRYDTQNINIQNGAYIETYERLRKTKDYQWQINIDVDEYIDTRGVDLLTLLNNDRYKEYDTIYVPWVFYDDNDKLRYEDGSVFTRFPNPSKDTNHANKSIIRIGKKIANKNAKCLHHGFLLEGKKCCWSDGCKVGSQPHTHYICYYTINRAYIFIRHYKSKSLEEYIKRKWRRHWGADKITTSKCLTLNDISREYFSMNKKTPQKEKIFSRLKEISNKDINVKLILNTNLTQKQLSNFIDQVNCQTFRDFTFTINVYNKFFNDSISDIFKPYTIHEHPISVKLIKYNIHQLDKLLENGNDGYDIYVTINHNYHTNFIRDLLIEEAFK